jgi:hypothetical protein
MSKLLKSLATATGLAALLALGGCGDRGSETAAQRDARTETAQEAQNPMTNEDAAARAAAQRSASRELAQGSGS